MRLFEGTEFDIPPTCERCGKLAADCDCPPLPIEENYRDPGKQTARLAIEKRKRGKTVTVVRGLDANDNDLSGLLVQLKNACGAGGTIKEDTVEIQGDHRERITECLRKMGYNIR